MRCNLFSVMLTKIHGIVLHSLRYNDTHHIITLYTPERGRVACLSSAGNSRSGKLRNSRLGLMAVIESDINFKESRELQYLGKITPVHPWKNLYFDPMKSSVVLFLSEFLNKLLMTYEADENLWKFLLYSLETLDSLKRGIANFHLAFLIRLLPFMGIDPDMSDYEEGKVFDMRSGGFGFQSSGEANFLTAAQSERMRMIMKMNYRNMHCFRFNVEERREILNLLLKYYTWHLPLKGEFKSPDILKEIYM